MSETMVHKRILRKCGGDLEHAIRSRCIEPCSKEDYINATDQKKTGRNWYIPPIENKTSGKPISTPNKPQYRALLKCHKCGRTSHFANNFPKRKRINQIEIEKAEDRKETVDVSSYERDCYHSDKEEFPDELNIEIINVSFEVTDVHTHLQKYSGEFMDLIHVQDSKMQRKKPFRGKVHTAGSYFITNIVMNTTEAKIHFDSGSF
ncbi:hypothetical protein O181_015637 [Austropuccinia psidii MF-1]|uniref:Uncharacterized protein n=1 Tax=Austropuccinia psidii MF-1 TaxID=1389203 RepID=A0A9Q3C425_9BASI|nr:hypothetical protein [Austropuccinia psidii MF-1]